MWFSQARGLTDVGLLAAQVYFDDSILALLQLSKLLLSELTYSNTKRRAKSGEENWNNNRASFSFLSDLR